MDRFDFYLAQLVSESEVDGAFDAAEQADWDMMADFGLVGIASGLVATQHAPTADFTIDITAGACYDPNGQRIEVGSGQTVDLSVDSDSNSTAIGGSGNSKVLSVFLYAERSLSDPRVDGNSNTVQFSRAETFAFKVVQGSEATTGTETAPSLEADKILVCDVTIDFGQTQILTADVNSNAVGNNRRQDAFVMTAGNLEVRQGTPESSDAALLTLLNNHVTGVATQHDADDINVAVAATWHDAATIAATDVDAALEEIITDLTDNAGSDRIGAAAYTANSIDLSTGSIQDQLRQIANTNTVKNFWAATTYLSAAQSGNAVRITNATGDLAFTNENGSASENSIHIAPSTNGARGRNLRLKAQDGDGSFGGDLIIEAGGEGALGELPGFIRNRWPSSGGEYDWEEKVFTLCADVATSTTETLFQYDEEDLLENSMVSIEVEFWLGDPSSVGQLSGNTGHAILRRVMTKGTSGATFSGAGGGLQTVQALAETFGDSPAVDLAVSTGSSGYVRVNVTAGATNPVHGQAFVRIRQWQRKTTADLT